MTSAMRTRAHTVRPGVLAIALTVALGTALTVGSLADSVPGTFRRILVLLPFTLPTPLRDFSSAWGVHFVAWAVLTFVTVPFARRWTDRMAIAVAALAFGVLLEIGQERLSTVRAAQAVDLDANLRGVVVGFTAAACLVTLRSRWGRNRRRHGAQIDSGDLAGHRSTTQDPRST